MTAAGPVVLTTPTTGPATLVVVPGFTATAVADRVYGTVTGGKPAVVDRGRHRHRAASRHPHPHRDRRHVPAGGQSGPALRTAPRGRHMTADTACTATEPATTDIRRAPSIREEPTP